MAETFGTTVMAVPSNLTAHESVEGGAHITLAYFGDAPLSAEHIQELRTIVQDLAMTYPAAPFVKSDSLEAFGENQEAIVLTVNNSEDSAPVILRNELLDRLSPELRAIFDEVQTFPVYRPHVTIGYRDKGFEPTKLIEVPSELRIGEIGLWNEGDRENYTITGFLAHYGTPRESGRYPWGSGDNPYQRNSSFLGNVETLRKQGMTYTEISRALGFKSTTQFRARYSIASNEVKKEDRYTAQKLREKGWSHQAIAEYMGKPNESSIRSLLKPSETAKKDSLQKTVEALRSNVNDERYIDVGVGVERYLGVSKEKLATAVAVLTEEGYTLNVYKTPQLGTSNETTMKILTPPGVTYSEFFKHPERIKNLNTFSEDMGNSFIPIQEPKPISSKRVGVRYAEDGGALKDGVIELRRGVKDLDLGEARYAQVRVKVDDGHYLKGMAMYSDSMPDGVDIMFNTNKSDTGNKLDAMKALKDDLENPFGSIVRQKTYLDSKGNTQLSPLNIVGNEDPEGLRTPGEEGGWGLWSKTLSSQFLSKQSPDVARDQLNLTYAIKKAEFDEIQALTNPAVKKKLLNSFADDMDSSAVHLKAAGLPRTANHVILPINSLKDNEIYAPQYNNGETVVLVRHPHGGIFEIPQLTVNNRNKEANSLIKNARDAVGINAKVAEQLSGADFDGDTVLVIPNNQGKIKIKSPLRELRNFNAKEQYRVSDEEWFRPSPTETNADGTPKMIPQMDDRRTGLEMGIISNLITDMTIMGASDPEIARAVKHSMVVIDAAKHHLDFKQSYKDNNIKELKKKYQPRDVGAAGGASTIISRAKSEAKVLERKPRPMAQGGPVDPETGRRVFVETGRSYVNKKGVTVVPKTTSTKMAETDDAFTLVSKTGMPIESVYATHANRLKALANEARKAALVAGSVQQSASAKEVYASEVTALKSKLDTAIRNKPLERQAQVVARINYQTKLNAEPGKANAEKKKLQSMAIKTARLRTGASKQNVQITPSEWEAIQAGAISNTMLNEILANTDIDVVKEYATPRQSVGLAPSLLARARAMLANDYTMADIAAALGVSTSTLNKELA